MSAGYAVYDLDRCACERGEACDQHVPLIPHLTRGEHARSHKETLSELKRLRIENERLRRELSRLRGEEIA